MNEYRKRCPDTYPAPPEFVKPGQLTIHPYHPAHHIAITKAGLGRKSRITTGNLARVRIDRFFARLEQEPRPPDVPTPVMSRTRLGLLWLTAAIYAAIVAAVCTTTWLVRLDWQVMLFRPYKQWPELHAFLDYFVVLGQRGPTAVLIAAWLGWRCWRQRTLRPLLVMACALLLLNLSVGAAKIGMGREGPHYATTIGSNEMWLTGDIFPSGHTANAVVTWGILAYLATTPTARRTLLVIASVFALGVGATTVYLGTHWVSDVLLGWAAGLLILLALPWSEPLITRIDTAVLRRWNRAQAAPDASPGAAPPAGGDHRHPELPVTPLSDQDPRPHAQPAVAAGRTSGGRLTTVTVRGTSRPHPAHPEQPVGPATRR
ncbi:Membrane-associated phospholipid phosphatase [Streptomyces zhaozhouensis]|uniref:Membrane-associated phospholipid phosphatase n=1 Tax=Streptomyces zhaozhouensis TaxID=1300267 RepID=A0A286DT22_9ACTN|nr:Membrane-associated phospholipid phosphatase [Streptomyces zhaozhouensis]